MFSRRLVSVCAIFAGLGVGCSGAVTAKTTAKDAGTTEASDAGQSTGTDAAPEATTDSHADGSGAVAPQLITEPEQGLAPIYALIASAKHTLDMTMYELEDTQVTALLTTAAKGGVTVRVILDQNLEKSSNTTAYNALAAGNVQVHWADPTYAATHQKTITVDATTSAIMTLNLTSHYYATSRDFAVITTDSADVAAIEATFDSDFASSAVKPGAGDGLVWSPTSSQGLLIGLIAGAKTSLLVENEEMSNPDVVSALSSAAMRGVDVEVAMTASKSWDANFATLTAAGVKVVTYASSASLYIHAKVILADFGASDASVFIGSENFSDASLTENRELGVILTDPAIMTSINGTLSSDFSGGTAYP